MVMPVVRRFTVLPDVNPKAGLPVAPIKWKVDPHICYVPDVRFWVSPRPTDVTALASFRELAAQALVIQYSTNAYSRGLNINGKPTLGLTYSDGTNSNQGLLNTGANLVSFAFLPAGYYMSGVAKIAAFHPTNEAILLATTNSAASNAVAVAIRVTSTGIVRVRHGATTKSTAAGVVAAGVAFIWEASYDAATGAVRLWINGAEIPFTGGGAVEAPGGTVTHVTINYQEGAGVGSYQHLGELFVSAKPVTAQDEGDRAARLAAQSIYWGIPLAA